MPPCSRSTLEQISCKVAKARGLGSWPPIPSLVASVSLPEACSRRMVGWRIAGVELELELEEAEEEEESDPVPAGRVKFDQDM